MNEQTTNGKSGRLLNLLAGVCAVMQTLLAILAVCLVPWVSSVNKNLENLNINLARIDERVANVNDLRARHESLSERLRTLELAVAAGKNQNH